MRWSIEPLLFTRRMIRGKTFIFNRRRIVINAAPISQVISYHNTKSVLAYVLTVTDWSRFWIQRKHSKRFHSEIELKRSCRKRFFKCFYLTILFYTSVFFRLIRIYVLFQFFFIFSCLFCLYYICMLIMGKCVILRKISFFSN